MKSWSTTISKYKIHRVLNIRSNVFLISGGKGHILVDTGMRHTFALLMKNIRTLGLKQGDIDYLLLTHSHYDHCQNAALIKEIERCEIIMSACEAEDVKNGYTTIPGGSFAITEIITRLGKKIGKKWFGYYPFSPGILVEEKTDLRKFGFAVDVISTPGHSKGSVSIVVDNEISIVGDTLYRLFKNTIMPPFADDNPEMIKSWGKLLDTGCKLFLPGHGEEIDREFLLREYERRRGGST